MKELECRNGRRKVVVLNTKEPDQRAIYERCAYCNSPLNYAFYFCTVCATPYRPISEVIPPVVPPVLSEGELIKKNVPNVWRVFWTYAIVIFFVSLLSFGLFESEEQGAHILIFGSTCIVLTTIAFEVIFWRSLVVQLKQFRFLSAKVFLGFLLLILLLILNFGYHWLLVYLLGEGSIFESPLYKTELSNWTMFVFICLIPGITEEIAFRGLIQHWLHTVLKPWRAILLASALFTALHLSVVSAPYIFLLGILLGWVKWKSGSLYPSILMHITHNCVAVTLFPIIIQ
jgi:membrane protease YdiL (CAAX protease family)